MLFEKLHPADSQIARIQEETESDEDDSDKIDRIYSGNNNSRGTVDDGRSSSRRGSATAPPKNHRKFLKKIRTSSMLSRRSISDSSVESIDSLSSHSDSAFCNSANMPNKITGEMGVEILPSLFRDGSNEEIMFRYVHDRHFQYIHPSVFAPACLTGVRRMGGGGSGVAVFSGTHPILGEIVMKHGGCSDMKELFALATISAELAKRGNRQKNGTGCEDSLATTTAALSSEEAARNMISCLPEFKMVYISPQHILFKQKAVWGKLKKLFRIGTARTRSDSVRSLTKKIELSERHLQCGGKCDSQLPQSSMITLNDSTFLGPGASIRIYQCESASRAKAYLEEDPTSTPRKKKDPSLAFVIPQDRIRSTNPTTLEVDCSDDFNSLQHVYEDLSKLMSKHLFKFTLAQKRIGGESATTGSQWLYEGKLVGSLLDNLITKFVRTVQDLQALTLPDEVDVVDQLRDEIQKLDQKMQDSDDAVVQTDDISEMADEFLGTAIKKNFHSIKGRIPFLSKTCNGFKSEEIFLMPEEQLPAKFLAALNEPGVLMSDIFLEAPSEPPGIQPNQELWTAMLYQAISDRPGMSPNATKRLWTSGLCDAGIHNLFVCQDDLYFFDLGVPKLQSLPGFMTKFLFSFFHVLGMQEDETSLDNEWVRRFNPEGDKLALTPETTDLLKVAYEAFEVSLCRIIDEIFDGDQSLRWLLLQYVTLQLLSDAAFCLQRWQLKGGGSNRGDEHHDKGLEQWLWRALWDMYVASDINTIQSWHRLQIEHPDCPEDLNETIGETLRTNFEKSIANFADEDLEDLVPFGAGDTMERIEEEMKEEAGSKDPRSSGASSVFKRSTEIFSSATSENTLRSLTRGSFFSLNRPSDNTAPRRFPPLIDDYDDFFSDEESERNLEADLEKLFGSTS